MFEIPLRQPNEDVQNAKVSESRTQEKGLGWEIKGPGREMQDCQAFLRTQLRF